MARWSRLTGTVAVAAMVWTGLTVPSAAADTADDWTFTLSQASPEVGGFSIFESDPNTRSFVTVVITNRSEVPRRYALATSGVDTEQGILTLRDPDPADPATWLSLPLNDREITIDPRRSVRVAVALRPPADPPTGDHGAAVVATDEDGRTLLLPLVLRVPGIRQPGLEFRSTLQTAGGGLWPASAPTQQIDYELVNTGNTVAAGDVEVGLVSFFGRFTPADPTRQVVLLPGDRIAGSATSSIAPAGSVHPELRFGVPSLAQDGTERRWTQTFNGDSRLDLPWAVIGVPIALVLLGSGAWIVRVRSARRDLTAVTASGPQPE